MQTRIRSVDSNNIFFRVARVDFFFENFFIGRIQTVLLQSIPCRFSIYLKRSVPVSCVKRAFFLKFFLSLTRSLTPSRIFVRFYKSVHLLRRRSTSSRAQRPLGNSTSPPRHTLSHRPSPPPSWCNLHTHLALLLQLFNRRIPLCISHRHTHTNTSACSRTIILLL